MTSRAASSGSELTFDVTAADPDLPPNTLSFLLMAPPAGATLAAVPGDPLSRRFHWTPTREQGGGRYVVTLRVIDDGAPARTVEQSVSIAVARAPEARVTLLKTLRGDEPRPSPVNCVAFSRDERLLASGSYNRRLRLWDLATGEPVDSAITDGMVYSLAFDGEGSRLASGSEDNTVRLWDLAAGQTRHTLAGHAKIVSCLAFSPDGRTLASGSFDQTVRLWDLETGLEMGLIEQHKARVQSVAFGTRKSQVLATAGNDGTIRLWKVAVTDGQ